MGPAVRRPGPARRPRRQHGPRRAHPRAGGGGDRERLWVARHRADHAHRPGRPATTISYADVGRGPDTSALLDAALAAGRQGEPLANLIGAPQAAIHGVTLDSAVAYDRDKLAAAVDDPRRRRSTRPPSDASVSAGQGGTFSVSPAKDGRAVDKAALLTALDQQLAALDARRRRSRWPCRSCRWRPPSPPRSAEAAKAAADRMAADVVVARGKDSWTIAGTSLAPLISFSTGGGREHHPGLRRVGPRPDPRDAGQEGQPDRAGRGPQAGQADTSSPPAPAARAGRSTLPA